MKRLDLLKQMSFGSQIAEDEVNALASYFVETNQWQKIANGEIDIIRGEKGAGKSAIDSNRQKNKPNPHTHCVRKIFGASGTDK
jgi:hypothetical protein